MRGEAPAVPELLPRFSKAKGAFSTGRGGQVRSFLSPRRFPPPLLHRQHLPAAGPEQGAAVWRAGSGGTGAKSTGMWLPAGPTALQHPLSEAPAQGTNPRLETKVLYLSWKLWPCVRDRAAQAPAPGDATGRAAPWVGRTSPGSCEQHHGGTPVSSLRNRPVQLQ